MSYNINRIKQQTWKLHQHDTTHPLLVTTKPRELTSKAVCYALLSAQIRKMVRPYLNLFPGNLNFHSTNMGTLSNTMMLANLAKFHPCMFLLALIIAATKRDSWPR